MKSDSKNINDWGIIQKRNKSTGKLEWFARIVRKDGSGKKRQHTRKAESKAEARRFRNELSEQFADRGENALDGSKMYFRELATLYKERRLVEAVYHGEGKARRKVAGMRSLQGPLHYLNVLKEELGAKLLRNITHSDVEELKAIRLRTPKTNGGVRSIADVNRTLELLRAILRFAVRQGWLNRSPFEMGSPLISKADENRREEILSPSDEKKLLAACTGRRSHLRPLIITAVDTAMRRGELFKLQWKDVDLDQRTIIITALNSKTARQRTVGMTPRVHAEFSKLWQNSPQDLEGLVFGITDTIKTGFASALKEAGITNLTFHDLRHTAITRMIASGTPPMECMKVSGHTQYNTFARYVNVGSTAVTNIAQTLAAYQERMNQESQKDESSGNSGDV